MLNTNFTLYIIARYYILRPKHRQKYAKLYRQFIPVMIDNLNGIIDSINNKTCPYCGRKFKGFPPLRNHLVTSICRYFLRKDIERVIEVYLAQKRYK